MFQIRRAVQDDIEGLLDLTEEGKNYHNSLLSGYLAPINKDFHRNRLAEYIQDKDAVVLAACHKGRVVGMLLAYFKSQPWLSRPSVCLLETLCIDPRFRRRGIGRKLIGSLEKIGADRKVSEIILSVYRDNAIAADLYQKSGYEIRSIQMTKKL